MMSDDRPVIRFSIVIPCYNESLNIGECIQSLRSKANLPFIREIIVVDNGSDDGTISIVKQLGVHLIENRGGPRCSISRLRNLGAHQAAGRILLFLDADMRVPPEFLGMAAEYFSRGFQGVLGFVETVPPNARWVGSAWGKRFSLRRNRVMKVDFLPGRNMFINREVFETINGFNEDMRTAEDKDLTMRVLAAGYEALSVPGAGIVHLGYERTLWEFVRKEFWRQSDTLRLAQERGYSLRSLRNPMLSALHVVLFSTVLFLCLTSRPSATFAVVGALWLMPSVLLIVSQAGIHTPPVLLLQLIALSFLRWNVSGLALMNQLRRYIRSLHKA